MMRVLILYFILSLMFAPGFASCCKTKPKENIVQKDAIVAVERPKLTKDQHQYVNLCYWIVENYSPNYQYRRTITQLIIEFLGVILPDNHRLEDPSSGTNPVLCVTVWARFSLDDHWLVTKTQQLMDRDSASLMLWHVETGQSTILGDAIFPLMAHKLFPEKTCVFTADNQQVIVGGSMPHTIEIWSLRAQARVNTLRGHHNFVEAISLSSNDKFILSNESCGYAYVWHRETGKCVRRFWQEWGWSRVRLEWSFFCNRDQHVVSSDSDAIYLWSVRLGWGRKRAIKAATTTTDWIKITGGIISRDQRHLVFATISDAHSVLYVWQLPTLTSRLEFREHTTDIDKFCFVRGDMCVASIDISGIAYIWQLTNGNTVHRVEYNNHFGNYLGNGPLRSHWVSRKNIEYIQFGFNCCWVEVESGRAVRTEHKNDEIINFLDISSNGRFIVVQMQPIHNHTQPFLELFNFSVQKSI